MAGVHRVSSISGGHNHGIQFLNEDWNESISNDQTYLLKWNESISANLSKDLGLFTVSYPSNGTIVYHLATNLTDYMESSSCQWKPHDLNDGLYALWLSTTDVDGFTNWTVSPPWKAKINQQQEEPVASRLAPYIAPISALLLIYALCLGLYWIVKKRRAKRRAAEAAEKAARARRTKQFKQRGRSASTTAQPSIRSPSVNTVTYDILEENNPQKKDEIFIYSAAGANMRRGSDDVIDSPLSDATLIEEHEQALANAAVRFYR